MAIRSRLSMAIWVMSVLAFLLICTGICAIGLMHSRPDLLRDPVVHVINRLLPNGHFSADAAEPSFWPSPGIRLKKCLFTLADSSTVRVEELKCHLRWAAFLQGKIEVAAVELRQPLVALSCRYDILRGQNPLALLPSLFLLNRFNGLSLRVHEGVFRLYPRGGLVSSADLLVQTPMLDMERINAEARFPYRGESGSLEIAVGSITQRMSRSRSDSIPDTIKDLRIRADGLTFDPAAPYGLRVTQADLSLTGDMNGFLKDTSLSLTLLPPENRIQRGTLVAKGALHVGELYGTKKDPAGLPVPFRIHFPFTAKEGSLNVSDGLIKLEGDSMRLNLSAKHGVPLKGRLDITKVRLSRWFSFVRGLPGGLASALDSLTGTLDFTFEGKKVKFPQLRVALVGVDFVGKGSFQFGGHPSLWLDVGTSHADLNRLIPELVGRDVLSPSYVAPPPFANTGRGPNYRIVVRADNAKMWDVESKGLYAVVESISHDTTRLTLSLASLYGGTAYLTADYCGGKTEKPVSLETDGDGAALLEGHVRVADLDLKMLPGQTNVDNVMGGKLGLEMRATSRFNSIEKMFRVLKGSWNLSVNEGYMETGDLKKGGGGNNTYKLQEFSAVGTVANEIADIKDIRVVGKNFSALGSGSLNLRDYTFTYSMNTSIHGKSSSISYKENFALSKRSNTGIAVVPYVIGQISKRFVTFLSRLE